MSLDLDLYCECDSKCCKGILAEFNITYNLSAMWRAAVDLDERLVEIEGMTGLQSSLKIQKAINSLIANPVFFKTLNPSNGWGSYEGLVDTLQQILVASKRYPNAVWRASR